jgi:uncharacterized protein (DUF305 family)
MKRVDLRTVQELMGHKTIAMTLKYAHLSPEHQMEAVQRLVKGVKGLQKREIQRVKGPASPNKQYPEKT